MSDIFAQYARKAIEQYRKDAEEGRWVNGDVAIVVREIDRLREALRDAMQYLYDMGDFDKADEVRAALEEGKE